MFMNINFLNNVQELSGLSKNINNNMQKKNLSFKGKTENNSSQESKNVPNYSEAKVSFHPLFNLEMELIKDGFTKEEIKSAELTEEGFFPKHKKDTKDIQAMLRTYRLLKEKLCTSDVKEHIEEKIELYDEIADFLRSRGKEVKSDKRNIYTGAVLPILSRVNKNNEPIVKMLLEDENFDNTQITQALINITGKDNSKYGIKTLEMAQEIGYDKEFSFPLAVIISEANENNIEAIEKMLHEQEFFVDNYDFVANGLMFFLRGYDGLLPSYKENPDLTMGIVKELKEMDEVEE